VSSLPYIGFTDGAIHSTKNLVFVSWAIYAPTDELISLHGVCLGRATKNIAKYSAIIKLLTDAISLGICHLIIRLNSQFVVVGTGADPGFNAATTHQQNPNYRAFQQHLRSK
jgi:ribonuclease HI